MKSSFQGSNISHFKPLEQMTDDIGIVHCEDSLKRMKQRNKKKNKEESKKKRNIWEKS